MRLLAVQDEKITCEVSGFFGLNRRRTLSSGQKLRPSIPASVSQGKAVCKAQLRNWFSWPCRFFSIGPSVSQTFFDAGFRRATVAQYQAQYDADVAAGAYVVSADGRLSRFVAHPQATLAAAIAGSHCSAAVPRTANLRTFHDDVSRYAIRIQPQTQVSESARHQDRSSPNCAPTTSTSTAT
jgi:hypothetical protein